jgi:pimeloyl-ACP methyl ester carboxylesterase
VRLTGAARIDSTVGLADGRRLAFCEWGDLSGRPVVPFHGTPGSRLLRPDEEATTAAGVRLITIDRPGYGRSDPRPDRTLLSWAEDSAEFVGLLRLPPCPIIGWSAGGPHALACAVRTPALVGSVGLVASIAPLDEVPSDWDGVSQESRELIEMLPRDRAAAIAGAKRRFSWYAEDPGSMWDAGGDSNDPDAELLADAAARDTLIGVVREGARQGSVGYVAAWIAQSEPWGFNVADVSQAAQVWWGERDTIVNRAEAEYLARTIPKATLTTYPNDGHLSLIHHWAEMLAALS